MAQATFMGFMNLHDAFLNASLQKRHMDLSPVALGTGQFDITDRGRFERAWGAFLYVLVEAWQSPSMADVRDFVATMTSLAELTSVLDEGAQQGGIAALRETRHYMCHRDRREYWDQGRQGVVGRLDFNVRLHDAFSQVLLDVSRKVNQGDRGTT